MSSTSTDVPSTSDNSFSMKLCINSIKAKFPSALNVSTHTLHTWIAEQQDTQTSQKRDLMILDCREDSEYDISRLDGSVKVDADAKDVKQTEQTIRQKISATDSGMNVVCYCSLGYRSSKYAQLLAQQLKEHNEQVSIYNLEGSLFKWANEGRPMVDGNGQPVTKVHPYNTVFGKFLNKELRASMSDGKL